MHNFVPALDRVQCRWRRTWGHFQIIHWVRSFSHCCVTNSGYDKFSCLLLLNFLCSKVQLLYWRFFSLQKKCFVRFIWTSAKKKVKDRQKEEPVKLFKRTQSAGKSAFLLNHDQFKQESLYQGYYFSYNHQCFWAFHLLVVIETIKNSELISELLVYFKHWL